MNWLILIIAGLFEVVWATAYAVWTGIGAIGGVVVGIAAFGESASETLYACNTYQFADYSRYDMTLFTEEEKRAYRGTHFATDLANARALGKRLVEKAGGLRGQT